MGALSYTEALAQEAYQEASVRNQDVPVYSSPKTITSKISTLKKGTSVQVFKRSGTRYLVQFRSGLSKRQGWVEGKDLALVSSTREKSPVKAFQAVITAERVVAHEKPSKKSRIVGDFIKDERIEIVAQTTSWLKVLLKQDGPIRRYGFIRKGTAELLANDRAKTSSQTEMGTPERKSERVQKEAPEAKSASSSKWKGQFFSLEATPLFGLKRYGATQFRVGALYEFTPSENTVLGFPFRHALGGGFKTMQFGPELGYSFVSSNKFNFGMKVSPLGELFYGSGRSFWAVIVGVGPTMRYALGDFFWIGWDPFIFEYAFIRTKSVPSFSRWQSILRFGGRF